MTDAELLTKVKNGLGLSGTYNDEVLKIKIAAVKAMMLNAGVTVENIETDLGVAVITVGVNDLWNLQPGEINFSPAFNIMITQLMVVSLP